jgi:bifunctional non-homologous end joining protein LigD
MGKADQLQTYKQKRDFSVTSEPQGGGKRNESNRAFVIQKHWATRLHYDLRLELNGTMKSWAVPKGPSLDPRDKRMAIHVEDHPISYNTFEGIIPAKQYGAGKVIIWDKGTWHPLSDPYEGYKHGNLKFELSGQKLHGRWVLVRMKSKGEKHEPWLLIKEKDEIARPAEEFNVVEALPDSVANIKSAPAKKSLQKKASAKLKAVKSGKNKLPADAIKAPLPATFKPQLATLLVNAPANSEDWIYEIKFDGYRLLTRIEGKKIQLFTRNGNDWTHKLTGLADEMKKLGLASGWMDGEIVVLNSKGIPDFQALQGAFDHAATQQIVYYIFDVPFYDGFDLRTVPLIERKEFLRTLLEKSSSAAIRFSDTFTVAGHDVLNSACHLGLEGVIGKRKTSTYVSRRSADWIKLKCTQRQEFVIGGYTDPQGSRSSLGSLLLGVYDEDGKLHYCGNVGTGFNSKSLADIKQKLDAVARTDSPFAENTGIGRKAHWIEPTLIAEVSFAEWTATGHIRHSVFHGLRVDKKAKEVRRETAAASSNSKPDILPNTLKVTHPDRIIDPSTHTTKIDLIQYYSQVAPLMMEHLKARPVSLVRAPDGITGQLFFQKHMETATMPGIKQLDPALDPDHSALLTVAKPEGLLSAAQMNVLEFHTWNALISNIHKPDRMNFDLDPGEGVAWSAMQEAATLVRTFLKQLQLSCFLKTSGGKGLHIVVPLKRLYSWETVKDFSEAIVQHLAATLPKHFSAKSGPRNRVGKIFIDYLRNGFGATTAAAWSVRARPGLGVSVPVAWSELTSLTSSAQWNIANIQSRLDIGNEPWKDYSSSAQNLGAAMKILGFQPTQPARISSIK